MATGNILDANHLAEARRAYLRARDAGVLNDMRQVGGNHYKDCAIQPWDAMEAWMSPEEFRGFLRGNVIRYMARCWKKNGLEDLEKAAHYLDKLIEVETAKKIEESDHA